MDTRVTPALWVTVLPEPGGLTGKELWRREAQVGEKSLRTAEALASASLLENKIVQGTQWGQYLEVSKIVIVQGLG